MKHQVRGNEQRYRCADATDVCRERAERQSGHGRQHDQRRPYRSECDRRRIRQQAEAGREERFETEPRQHGRRDGYGGSESTRAFNECAECESDEQSLQALVAGEAADRVLDDLEFSGFDGEAIEQQGGENDPSDGEDSIGGSVNAGAREERNGHAINEQRHRGGDAES
jgi:hypothetical protein